MAFNFSAFFVRQGPTDEALQAVFGDEFRRVEGSEWITCRHRGSPPDSAYESTAIVAEVASRALGEVIYLLVEGGCDQWRYEHVKDGVVLRALLCLGDPLEWLMIRGEPEPWEATGLFKTATLENWIQTAEDEIQDADKRDAEIARLRGIWTDRRLTIGAGDPRVDAGDIHGAVCVAYGLVPGKRMQS